MTERRTMTNNNTAPDWWAVTQAAQGLGVNTRRLVALHDTDAVITWALRMSREHTGVAALSYYELAVLAGHRDAKVTASARLDWNELLRSVEKLAGAVKAKAAEEKAAAEKVAAEKAAAKKAAAEKAAADKAASEAGNEKPPTDEKEAVPDAV
jgi:hypothetical protein